MTTSRDVNDLFIELSETSELIGVMEDYVKKATLGLVPDIPTKLTDRAFELYSLRYQLQRQIKEALEPSKPTKKELIKQLFKK